MYTFIVVNDIFRKKVVFWKVVLYVTEISRLSMSVLCLFCCLLTLFYHVLALNQLPWLSQLIGKSRSTPGIDQVRLIANLAKDSSYGTIKTNNQEIIRLIDEIRAISPLKSQDKRNSQSSLYGDWRLAWTTEKVRYDMSLSTPFAFCLAIFYYIYVSINFIHKIISHHVVVYFISLMESTPAGNVAVC